MGATKNSPTTPLQQHRVLVTDREAAVECLFILHRHHGDNCTTWPSNANTINTFVKNQSKEKGPFADWVRQGRESGEFDDKPKKIRKRLVKELKGIKVLCQEKGKLQWNRQKVIHLLAAHASVDRPAFVDNECESAGTQETEYEMSDAIVPTTWLIETFQQLQALKDVPLPLVAIDCEGVPEDLFLIQVGTPTATFVFDCISLGPTAVCDFLKTFLMDENVTKLFHDLHNDAAALASIGGITTMRGTLDTQLAMEHLTGDALYGFNQMLQELKQPQHTSKKIMKEQMKNNKLFSQRPLPRDVLQYAVDDVQLLVGAYDCLRERLGNQWEATQRASDMRARMAAASGGERSICFDVPNAYAIASYELLYASRPNDMMAPTPLEVSNDTGTLLNMLPEDLSVVLQENTNRLSDVVLDMGRRPHAWIGGHRLLLGDDNRLVEQDEIDTIIEKLGGFGSDNRAGLERQLHRISAIRNRESDIIGLTMRFGRHVSGNAGIISDLLFGDPTKSILFLGEPGAGKTTVVREVTRLLAERCNVCIVDTSNEIAGDGNVPHPCVGFARRMMVPSLDRQSAVMIECVQNHTPDVMIIDEIGRSTEVEAARTCKNRGVRLIASAHGDLRKLIKNPKLRGLIGGVETVTLGDAQAREEAKKHPGRAVQKTKAERAGPPTFDILVELKRGAHHEWRIILDSGDAVDWVLRGGEYKAQRRTRDPDSGAIHLELEMA